MSQWGKNDIASNSVNYAIKTEKANGGNTSATQATLFQNTTPGAIKAGQEVGQFAVDTTEQQVARASGSAKPAHSGWVIRREGTGGRAGRVTYETLVATGTIGADPANTAFGNDDPIFPDS